MVRGREDYRSTVEIHNLKKGSKPTWYLLGKHIELHQAMERIQHGASGVELALSGAVSHRPP
jgi:hypothetical protein